MVSEVADVTRGNAKVLERLGRLIDDLVVELTFNLVGGHDGPPQQTVEQTSHRLEDGLRDVDMSPLLVYFTVNKFRDLRGGVFLGTVQFIGLSGGVVIVEHKLQRLTYINDLEA